jgi:hypothetical protein
VEDSLEEKKDERLETLVAILIAIVVVIGALVAWRASVAEDASGDADYDGLSALVKAEETLALDTVNGYEDYSSYIRYWSNARLVELIDQDLEKASPEQAEELNKELVTATDLANANASFFERRFVNRSGTYNLGRQLGEMWADAQRENDLEYESKFISADRLRTKTQNLLLALMVLSIAPVFYALIESVPGGWRYVLLALGSLFAVAGTLAAILIDMAR